MHIFDPVPAAQPSAIKALQARLAMLEDAWDGRAFAAAGRFTAADILLADGLRASAAAGQLDGHPQLADYVARLTARPAFRKVHDEQVAEFEAATPPKDADKLMAGEDGVEKKSEEKTA